MKKALLAKCEDGGLHFRVPAVVTKHHDPACLEMRQE